MKTLWYYLSYPIRIMLREKVERYKQDIFNLHVESATIRPKPRREGMSMTIMLMEQSKLMKVAKYSNFIERWKIQ